MNRFSSVKFGDVATFKYGKMPEKEKIVSTGGYPIFTGYRVAGYYQDCMYDEPQLVVVARGVGGTGNVVISPPKSYITNLSIVAELDVKRCSREYLKYYFALNNLRYLDSGSAQSQITILDLKNLTIELPTNTEQRAIVALLGALDDKIELNNRMNATLEAAARALFKSWFVDFDPVKAKMAGKQPFGMDAATAALFPAHLTESELGDIPEGWRVSTIGELGRVVTGKTPSTADPENFGNDIPFITIPDLNGRMYISSTQRYLSKVGAQKVSSSIIPKGAVMMSCIATVGLCGITETASVTNQQINSLICKESVSLPSYVYWQFRNITNDVISSGGGGSVYTNVSKSRFENIKVLCPDYRVQELFDQDWFKKLRENEAENAKLAKLRDYLLPKLISGEIRIPDAEKFVEGLA